MSICTFTYWSPKDQSLFWPFSVSPGVFVKNEVGVMEKRLAIWKEVGLGRLRNIDKLFASARKNTALDWHSSPGRKSVSSF
jgi:hypothetical protein